MNEVKERMAATKKVPGRVLLRLALLPVFLCACSSIGPKRVPPDRFYYNTAIARSGNEQMLMNLVRLRYAEVPVFLALSSVLTQYTLIAELGVGGESGRFMGAPAYSVGGDAGLTYAERPRVTYSPMTGQDFAKQVLEPIPAALTFSLVQSGWPAEELLVMTL